MSRRNLFSQMSQSEDLSTLTNYDEKSVKPISDIAETNTVQQSSLYPSEPAAQPFSYTQPAAQPVTPSYAPTMTASPSLFGERAEKAQAAPQSSFSQTAERPMVFALRSEPGAYVYEYSDRLELYRYSPFSGVMLCDKKFKKR